MCSAYATHGSYALISTTLFLVLCICCVNATHVVLRNRKGPMTPALKSSPLGSYDANPRHLAWAAGLFDGDGCVHISKQTQPGRKHPTYRLCLSLVQNCITTAQRFQEILGLQAHLTAMQRTSKQNRVVYDVRFDGIHAFRALQLMQPDLFRKLIEVLNHEQN